MRTTYVRIVAVASIALSAVVLSGSADAGGAHATFRSYTVTDGTNPVSGGEPSIGYDPIRNAVMFGAEAHETRMVFDALGGVTQTEVSAPSAIFT
ncbi:MAG TPA: hypothetical protein VKJ07_04770, partial [Mycobacteriales bacterium]|nr:hypothetical protein [Mycobacteriales bacterium]